MLSAEDFNKVTSHSPKEINSADKSGFLLKFILNLGLENYKGYRENIKDEDKSNLQKGLNYLSKTTKGVVNPIKKNSSLSDITEEVKKYKTELKFEDIDNDRNKLLGSNPNYINILNLAKEGFDLSNLDLVMTKAELRPILDNDFQEASLSEEDITVLE